MIVEAIVAALDTVVAILRRRADSRRAVYMEFVDPIFEEVISVHADYRAMFLDALQPFEEKQHGFDEVVSDDEMRALKGLIARRREDMAAIRQKLEILARVLKDDSSLPPEASTFFEAVYLYFRIGAGDGEFLVGTSATTLLKAFHGFESGESVKVHNVKWILRSAVDDVGRKWQAVLDTYARARVALCR